MIGPRSLMSGITGPRSSQLLYDQKRIILSHSQISRAVDLTELNQVLSRHKSRLVSPTPV